MSAENKKVMCARNVTQVTYNARIYVSATIVVGAKYTFR